MIKSNLQFDILYSTDFLINQGGEWNNTFREVMINFIRDVGVGEFRVGGDGLVIKKYGILHASLWNFAASVLNSSCFIVIFSKKKRAIASNFLGSAVFVYESILLDGLHSTHLKFLLPTRFFTVLLWLTTGDLTR